MTTEVISWGIYKNAFEDVKNSDEDNICLFLLLRNIDTNEIREEIIILNKEDADMVDTMANKQLLPLLRGGKISRGEYAKKPDDMRGYG